MTSRAMIQRVQQVLGGRVRASQAKHGRRRPSRWAVVKLSIAAGLVLVVGAIGAYAATRPATVAYRLATVSPEGVSQTLQATGTIEPESSAAVSFPVAGKVAGVMVSPGDRVAAGQQLAALDTTSLALAVTSAQANLAASQLTVQQAESAQTAAATQPSTAAGGTGSGGTSSGGTGSAGRSESASISGGGSAGGDPASRAISAAQQKVLGSQHDLDTALTQATAALAAATATCAAPATSTGTPTPSGAPPPSGTPPPSYAPRPSDTPTGTPSPSATPTPTSTPSGGAPTGSGVAYLMSHRTPSGPATTGDAAACTQAEQQVLTEENAVLGLERTLSQQESALDRLLSTASRSPSSAVTAGGAMTSKATTGGAASSGRTPTSETSTGGGSAGTGSSGVVSAAQLAADQAQVDATSAALAVAEQNLQQATILSPIAGTVSAVGLTVGQQVSAGSTSQSIQVIGGNAHVVTLAVDVTKISQVRVGEAATVTPDGTSTALPATVVAVSVAPTTGTSYAVTLGLRTDPGGLRDGTNAAATVVTSQPTGALAIPTSAVHHQGQLAYVMVLNGSRPQLTRVTVGAVGSTYTEVTAGLSAGQQVVLADPSQPLPTGGTTPRFGGGGGGLGGGAGRGSTPR